MKKFSTIVISILQIPVIMPDRLPPQPDISLSMEFFGPCTITIIRFSHNFSAIDLSERFIHDNAKRSATIPYSVQGSHYSQTTKTFNSSYNKRLDISFTDTCSLTVVVNFDHNSDLSRRYFLYTNSPNVKRSRFAYSAVILLITKPLQLAGVFYRMDFSWTVRTFLNLVTIKRHTSEPNKLIVSQSVLAYFNPYSNIWINIVSPEEQTIPTMSPFSFKSMWGKVEILANVYKEIGVPNNCGNGMRELNSTLCSPDHRSADTLGKLLNVTFVRDVSYESMQSNLFGYYNVRITFDHWVGFESSTKVTCVYHAGLTAYYCNFSPRVEQISFVAWVAPFRRNVWISLLISICLSVFVSIAAAQRTSSLSISSILLDMTALLLRQSWSHFSNNYFFFIIFSAIMTLQFVYEFYITCHLIVPEPVKWHTKLIHFVDDEYKLVGLERAKGYNSLHAELESDFEQIGKLDKQNQTLVEATTNDWVQVLGQVKENNGKTVILGSGGSHISTVQKVHNVKYMENIVLQGKYQCTNVNDLLGMSYYVDILNFQVAEKAMWILQRFRESGLQNVWVDWRNLWFKNDISKLYWRKGGDNVVKNTISNDKFGGVSQADYISFRNLVSFLLLLVECIVYAL